MCMLIGFPQDQAVLYNMHPALDGSVLWEVRVHGIFYQARGVPSSPVWAVPCAANPLPLEAHLTPAPSPVDPIPCCVQPMGFQHYPFDSFDLLLELRFSDPTGLINTTDLYGAPHPGVTVVPSSGGRKVDGWVGGRCGLCNATQLGLWRPWYQAASLSTPVYTCAQGAPTGWRPCSYCQKLLLPPAAAAATAAAAAAAAGQLSCRRSFALAAIHLRQGRRHRQLGSDRLPVTQLCEWF